MLINAIRATAKAPQAIFDLFQISKARILSLALDPSAQPRNEGIRACAWKYVQKVLLAGTRAAAADPRVSPKSVYTEGYLAQREIRG
jgi:symplekin